MVAKGSGSRQTLAAEVWRLMAEFTFARLQGGRAMHALKSLGLTPGHLKVLTALQPGEALPMGALAEMLSCDPSMATWLIDRLEDRHLVERRMLATDRRVKVVSLTARGVKVKTRVLGDLLEPPEELLALDDARLEALRGALSALPPSPRPFAPTRSSHGHVRRHVHGGGRGRQDG